MGSIMRGGLSRLHGSHPIGFFVETNRKFHHHGSNAGRIDWVEVAGEKGTRLIGEVKVTSGDGQEIKKEFDIALSQLTCP